MTNYYLDINVLQQVPPSNINRDDTGAPKTAFYGGVLRSRVSSQAWKRAVRKSFDDHFDKSDLGVRTRRAVEILADRIITLEPNLERADAVKKSKEALSALGLTIKTPRGKDADTVREDQIEFLVLFSNHQLDNLAQLAVETEGKITKKAAQNAVKIDKGVDLSLFGRMVADETELKVDASVQVAHALSTHAVEPEADYFTAVDDFKLAGDDAGAGMIGTIGFNSSTLYRYATINLNGLLDNIGDTTATARAAKAFVQGFVLSMPTGKQNTFANSTIPDAVLVVLRKGRSANLVGAFENPVPNTESGYLQESSERLADYDENIENNFLGAPVLSLVTRTETAGDALDKVGDRVALPELLDRIEAAVGEAIGE